MQKFDSIESLRGWMAWWVVLGHALNLAGMDSRFSHFPLVLALHGDMAVYVFMIVSGFVITHLLILTKGGYFKYLARRFWRLWPLMMLMIFAAIALRAQYVSAFVDNRFIDGAPARLERMQSESAHFAQHLLLHASLLHGLVPDEVLQYASAAFLAPPWSISLEWQFYILAPALFAMLTLRRMRSVVLLGVLTVISCAALSGRHYTWQYESFLGLALVYFLIGMTIRLTFQSLADGKPLPIQAFGFTLISLAAYLRYNSTSVHELIYRFGAVSVISLIFFGIAANEAGLLEIRSKIARKLAWLVALNPVAVVMGKISYSTYLCHIPVFSLVVGLGLASNPGYNRHDLAAWTLLATLLVIPASLLLHYGFEKPVTRWGNKLIVRFLS